MRTLSVIPMCLAVAAAMPAIASEDAAEKVQEGDVKQWMEYYQRERGHVYEPVADDRNALKTDDSGAVEPESSDSKPSQAPNTQPVD